MTAAFAGWLDRFFEAYYRQRPVNATFIGVHVYDERLSDPSLAGQAAAAAENLALLTQLRALPASETRTDVQELDRQLAEGFLEIAAWEATSAHYAWGNPSLFTGEAVFGLLSLLLGRFAPLAERLDLAAARLAAVPRFLDDARLVLHDAPGAWSLRARRECAGAALLLHDGLPRLLADSHVQHAGLLLAANQARDAFARFDAFIETELLPHASETYGCGAEHFDLLLRRAHFLDYDADELERLARDRMAEEAAAIAAGASPAKGGMVPRGGGVVPLARTVAGRSVAQRGAVATGARGEPVDAATPYLERFARLWTSARDLAEQRELLSFPDWPVRYVEQPAWLTESVPYFYFLPYRSPAPFDNVEVVDYVVPPHADDSTIKLNHVVHHGSLGHHVQNWHAARTASRIGQVAAVDCASRIAMLCGGSMAEGWACYATDVADEAGFLTPAESFAQHIARLRMAARALVDLQLHQGRMSLTEAAQFYVTRVGLADRAAQAESVKNSLFPGAACMYLVGWDGIWRLRGQRADLPLRSLHDQLLSLGSVPVALAGQLLSRQTGFARWQQRERWIDTGHDPASP